MENNNEQELSHTVITKDGTVQEIFPEGESTSLSQEMLWKEELDDLNLKLISVTDPVEKSEMEARMAEIEKELGLEHQDVSEYKMAA